MLRTRAELVRVLAQASELEHALCCQYLFAAFALKTHIDEDDVTWEQLEIARGWKTTLLGIARQEMEHLAYANNLLTAIGGAPHFQRPDFPIAHRNYSIHVRMGLLPVTQVALERFICIERPESLGRDHAFCAHLRARTPTRRRNGVGAYESIGELYSKIRRAFSMMDEKRLFIGPPQAQVTTQALGLGRKGFYGMRTDPVVDRDSALAAIDQICIEGEGGPGRPTKTALARSHYGRLVEVRRQFMKEQARCRRAGEPFALSRPVVANPLCGLESEMSEGTPVGNPRTLEVMHLFNLAYETQVLFLARLFAYGDETPGEASLIEETAFWPLMTMCIRPLGEILTMLPATDVTDGPTAGPAFFLSRGVQTLPHRAAADTVFTERLDQLARDCGALAYARRRGTVPRVRDRLRLMQQDLQRVAENFRHGLRHVSDD